MDELTDIFEKLDKRTTYLEIAARAGVSRNTIYNVRKSPDSAKLGTLRKIFSAMGYNLVLKLERKEVT